MKTVSLKIAPSGDEGIMRVSSDFDALDGLLKKDILKDWINELTEYYDSISIWGKSA